MKQWTRDAQGIMSGAATSYDMTKLVAGVILAAVSCTVAAIAAYPILAKSPGYSTPFLLMTLFYGIMMFASSYVEEEHNFWYWAASGWLVFLTMRGYDRLCFLRTRTQLTLASSDWAFPLLTISGGIALAALRITRRWNQTGQKFAGEPDIARTFLSQHTTLLWILIVATYACNCYQLAQKGFPTLSRSLARPIAVVLTILALTFKLAFEHEDSPELLDWTATRLVELTTGPSLVFRARAVFIGIALALSYTIGIKFVQDTRGDRIGRNLICTALATVLTLSLASSYTIHYLITLFLITQSRASNVPLFLLFFLQLRLLNELNSRGIGTTTTSILFQYLSFFAFGGTNAISSVDLSSAYNGVSGFNVLAVGLLTFVSNWAGPVFWTSGMTILLRNVKENMGSHVLRGHIALLTVFTSFSVLAVMVACTVLRTHLFIWTVFSPKYLYSMAWSFGQHLFINVGLGSLLFWLAGK
jgi:ethanolaminephosphotransferase